MTGPLLRLAIAALVIHAALILPGVPQPAAGVLRAAPPELPLLLALLWLGGRIAQVAVTAGLALLVVQKLASLAMYQALGRGFNPVADLTLIDASVRLIAGSFGRPAAVAAVAGAVLALIVIVALIWWAAGCWSRRAGLAPAPAAGWLALAVAGLVAAGLATGVWRADSGAYATERIAIARRTLADLAQLRRDAATDPMAGRPDLLRGIDRDVIVVFVESYGRTSFRTPFYADTHLATLGQAQTALRDHAVRVSDCADAGRPKLAVARHLCERAVDRRPEPLSGGAGQRPADAVSPRPPGRVRHRCGDARDHATLARVRGHGF